MSPYQLPWKLREQGALRFKDRVLSSGPLSD
jgi:hypothetical protein